MPVRNNFPEDLAEEPMSYTEATRELLSWENTETTHIRDIRWFEGERQVTEVVVSTSDGSDYRAIWNGKRQKWAIGKLIRNPEAAKHSEH